MRIDEKVLKRDNHPQLASALNNLGNLLDMREEYEEAEGCFRRALGISKVALGVSLIDSLAAPPTTFYILVHCSD